MNYLESLAVVGLFIYLVAAVSLVLSLITPEEKSLIIIKGAIKNFWLISITAGGLVLLTSLISIIF
ncbi:MAG: hypothetical protein AAB019_07180 [Planctomycetota bacterium]